MAQENENSRAVTAQTTPDTTSNSTTTTSYQTANNRTHLVTGLIAGAAIAYLLTNKNAKTTISSAVQKAWGSVRGEVEELKERLADAQAELDYYRQQKKED